MKQTTLFDSFLSTKLSEYNEKTDNLSYKLPFYLPTYNKSFLNTPTSHKKTQSQEKRLLKISLQRPNPLILGDLDNIMGISDVYLQSSGILAKSRVFGCFSDDFFDVESQFNGSNSYFLDEINPITSICFKTPQNSYKLGNKDFSIPFSLNRGIYKENIDINIDEILVNKPDFINENEIDKILDYFQISKPKNKENQRENIENNHIITEEEVLYEILNNSNEKSFEMPIKSVICKENLFEEIDLLLLDSNLKDFQDFQPKSPKFTPILMDISDNLEIESIISKNSIVESQQNNLYFSFSETLNPENNLIINEKDSFQSFFNEKSFSNNTRQNIGSSFIDEKSSFIGENKKASFIGENKKPSFIGENKKPFFIGVNKKPFFILIGEKAFFQGEKSSFKPEKASSFQSSSSQSSFQSSFESFYEKAINKTPFQNKRKSSLLTEKKENKMEGDYVKKIITGTNNKKKNDFLCGNKENTANIVKKGKNQLNFKKNR